MYIHQCTCPEDRCYPNKLGRTLKTFTVRVFNSSRNGNPPPHPPYRLWHQEAPIYLLWRCLQSHRCQMVTEVQLHLNSELFYGDLGYSLTLSLKSCRTENQIPEMKPSLSQRNSNKQLPPLKIQQTLSSMAPAAPLRGLKGDYRSHGLCFLTQIRPADTLQSEVHLPSIQNNSWLYCSSLLFLAFGCYSRASIIRQLHFSCGIKYIFI